MSRRGATGLSGILLVDKPGGMTSHDVVAAVRRASGEGRIGHAGTLDPMATGLLVVLIGPATRLAPYLTGQSKSYEAVIAFGHETDTDDAEGTPTVERDVPASALDMDAARAALSGILGEGMQTPPAFSAIKVDGRTAHHAARAGEGLDLQPRPIVVHSAELLSVDPVARTWVVHFDVSKGTYVRALARDIGRSVGTAAHLSALRRTASGPLRLSDAVGLEAALNAARDGSLSAMFADPVSAVALPTIDATRESIADGRSLPRDSSEVADGEAVSVLVDGRLAAIYRAAAGKLSAEVVLPQGVAA